jgi:hypothetical protein
VSSQSKRVGVNEALFREVNERIDQLQEELETGSSFEIVCECGDAVCIERFTITADAYKELRTDVHRFAVKPGHEQPDVEQTVERRGAYLVVEKTDPDAARAAEQMA